MNRLSTFRPETCPTSLRTRSNKEEEEDLHCVCVCVYARVCMIWCVCIHNCLASCCAPIRDSIPPGLEGGEFFYYADTIDGNCPPAKNLKMWPPVCVSEPLLSNAHTSSGRESRRGVLDRFVAIATGNCRSRHSGLRCISGKRLKCARSFSNVFFDDRFVVLATQKPSITITSLVATSSSNPMFRHGTSDDMRAFLSRN